MPGFDARHLCCLFPLAVLLTAIDARAQSDDSPIEFGQCIATLQASAREAGISDHVVDNVLGSVTKVERVIELDRKQPEFTRTFADYYNRRVTEDRVARGRELLAEHRDLLNRVQDTYGVPAQYLVAFWGLETNFGSYFGNLPVPDSLATLACDPRRSGFFTEELLAALRIIDDGDITAEQMVGSWAGAMGNFQFLPSVFRRHAVDADGDQRRDVWNSIPDAVTSAANFLASLGWQRGYRWGREVRLPADFDYGLTGRDHRQALAFWAGAGVTDADGRALPALDIPAAILVPSGANGPAFIVYDNFDIIMRWNRSEYYAIAVGRLADRIAGAAELTRPPADADLQLTFEDVKQLQAGLQSLGYHDDEPDGLFGPMTRRALSSFQRDRGLVADGHPDAVARAAVQAALQEQQ